MRIGLRMWLSALAPALFAASVAMGGVEVVEGAEGGWTLQRDGESFFVKGVGGSRRMEMLAELGGNTIRTWGAQELEPRLWPDGRRMGLLDRAHELGLSVVAGFWVGHPRHGFDYSDEAAVRAQLEEVRAWVAEYKDHPALLMWGLGNEVELDADRETVYRAVNDIARVVKSIDPDHPTMYAMAGCGDGKASSFMRWCPDVDVMGINTYGGLASTPGELAGQGYAGPYIITEFGPLGHWEAPRTAWDAPIEQSSSEKAAFYESSYREGVLGSDACVGSLAFLWGNKQERTATWYGMFLGSGEKLASVDVMSKLWTGEWPAERAPTIEPIKTPIALSRVRPDVLVRASVQALDPNGDDLRYDWELRRESTDRRLGGDRESAPPLVESFENAGSSVSFRSPKESGAYRLFVTVYDGEGGAATANAPFVVE